MKKLRALWFSVIALGISAIFSSLLYSESKDLYELSIEGKTVIGTVVDYQYANRRGRKGRQRQTHSHLISYDQYFKWFDLGRGLPVQSRLYITYSLEDSRLARVVQDKSLWGLFWEELGWFGLLFCPGMIIVFGLAGISHLKDFFFTPSNAIDD